MPFYEWQWRPWCEYAWWSKWFITFGHFLCACCIAVDVPSGKKKTHDEARSFWENACSHFLFFIFFNLRLLWSSYLRRICSHWSYLSSEKSSVTREKICQLKWEILKLYDLLARIDRCSLAVFCFIWLVTVMRDYIDAVVCVCVVLTVPTYLHPLLLSPTPG